MHKTPLKLKALAAAMLWLPCFAHAAGLGQLTVQSALGQPLSARIELVSVSRDELNSLAARLASAERYREANLQYQQALNSLRFSVEQRPGGQPYIKVTSTRPMNEPVVDLLVELAWANGRISRAYTALIDPPGYGQQAAAEQPAAPPPATAAVPVAPPVVSSQPRPSAPIRVTPPRAEGPSANQYGPIRRGETLTEIAASVKPNDVTLEQMLVGLYRSNPDAFVNNMNRMKTGRILRVPAREEIAALPPGDAVKEVRVQAADWNAYRRRLADAAADAQEGSATSGRITARVDDQAAASPSRDVVRLSKGEAPGTAGGTGRGAGTSATERVRALEEEAIARDKALAEANERIAQLEKTIREQQRLLELKGAPLGTQAPGGQPAAEAPKPAPAAPASPPLAAADKPPAAPPVASTAETAAKPAAEAKPKPKVVPPPPAPSTDFMDIVFEEPLYLAAAGGVLALGLGYVLVARRRRTTARAPQVANSEPVPPALGGVAGAAALATPEREPARAKAGADAPAGEEVDALAEAEVYIAYGRDAQAEEILKDALTKTPTRQDVQLKLLEIYAARRDRSAFKEVASRLHRQTGGQGDGWNKAAAMGRTLDPSEALYAAAGAAAAGAAGAELLDLDLSTPAAVASEPPPAPVPAPAAATPVVPEARPAEPEIGAAPEIIPARAPEPQPETPPEPLIPDFTLEIPAAGTGTTPATADATPAAATTDSNIIDFKLELPQVEAPAEQPAPAPAASADPGLDFKLDFGDINLNLEGEPPAPASGADKDAHWHDVQQKFDLAKAYEEMGDKDGAREVLQEVVGEGDPEQQAQAKKLLEALA